MLFLWRFGVGKALEVVDGPWGPFHPSHGYASSPFFYAQHRCDDYGALFIQMFPSIKSHRLFLSFSKHGTVSEECDAHLIWYHSLTEGGIVCLYLFCSNCLPRITVLMPTVLSARTPMLHWGTLFECDIDYFFFCIESGLSVLKCIYIKKLYISIYFLWKESRILIIMPLRKH